MTGQIFFFFLNWKIKSLNPPHPFHFWCNNHQLRQWGFFMRVCMGKAKGTKRTWQAGKCNQLVYQNIILLQIVNRMSLANSSMTVLSSEKLFISHCKFNNSNKEMALISRGSNFSPVEIFFFLFQPLLASLVSFFFFSLSSSFLTLPLLHTY